MRSQLEQGGGAESLPSRMPLWRWHYAIYISVLIQLKSRLRQDNESSATCQEAQSESQRDEMKLKMLLPRIPIGPRE